MPDTTTKSAGTDPAAVLDEARTLHRAGSLAEAEARYRQVLDRRPDDPEAGYLLGLLLHQRGEHGPAVDLLRRAAERAPGQVPVRMHLGIALLAGGWIDEAVAVLQGAARIDAGSATVQFNLGNALNAASRPDDAIRAWRAAVVREPAFADALNNLGVALFLRGCHRDAVDTFERLAAVRPGDVDARVRLGAAYRACGMYARAMECLERAVAARPDDADLLFDLGVLQKLHDRHADACTTFEKVCRLRPDSMPARVEVAKAKLDGGEVDVALELYRGLIERFPQSAEVHSSYLLAQQYTTVDSAALLDEHRAWNDRFAAPEVARRRRHANAPDPERPLRIGYLSGDLRTHAVTYFLAPLLAGHDRERFTVHAYHLSAIEDGTTTQLRANVDVWSQVEALDDDALAARIAEDGVDVLVDLAGHTHRGRPQLLARRPAPVQVTWCGYPASTGVDGIDLYVADRHTVPDRKAAAAFSEQVLRLPGCFVCFAPPSPSPEVAPAPVTRNGHVTFGAFQNPAKLSEPCVRTWARVLERVSGSRLLLKYAGLSDPGTTAQVSARFAAAGLDPERLEFDGPTAGARFLEHYHRIDVALDTFPFNGGASTCHALWMGVPVIALIGDRHVARTASSMLRAAGLGELTASTEDGYVEVAAALAGDTARMAALRGGMRERLQASPLMDGASFARGFEAGCRDAWRRWCRTQSL